MTLPSTSWENLDTPCVSSARDLRWNESQYNGDPFEFRTVRYDRNAEVRQMYLPSEVRTVQKIGLEVGQPGCQGLSLPEPNHGWCCGFPQCHMAGSSLECCACHGFTAASCWGRVSYRLVGSLARCETNQSPENGEATTRGRYWPIKRSWTRSRRQRRPLTKPLRECVAQPV